MRLSVRRRIPQLFAAICIAAGGMTAHAQLSQPYYNANLLDAFHYGIVCPGGEANRVPAPGTALGYVTERTGRQPVVYQTLIVPAQIGVSFGIEAVNVSGAPLADVIVTTIHPPFKNNPMTRDTWVDQFETDSYNTNSFSFDFPFEVVTGTWTLEASHEGHLLYRVVFNIVDPVLVPDLEEVCAKPGVIS